MKRFLVVVSVALLLTNVFVSTTFAADCPSGMSKLDCQAILQNWPNWVPNENFSNTCTDRSSAPGSADTSSSTGDNPQTVYAFFRSAGLDDMHAAAVYGNLYQESAGMNPTIMQKGGTSNNPADADPGGWGLAQWTPGSKVTAIAQGYGINTPIYQLTSQENLILKEMHDVSPAGAHDTWNGLLKQTTLSDAVDYFMNEFEAAGTPGPRLTYAQQGLSKYGGQDYAATATGCNSGSLSPDCQTAAGSAKILCAAKKYDPVSYSESLIGGHQGGAAWHQSCPTVGPSCYLDCSGLVNIAVYDAFGIDLRENTGGERDDIGKYWDSVSFSQLQPGDLIQPGKYDGGHVEIVDHVVGNKIFTFGAHTSQIPQPEQVSSSEYVRSSGDLYLHFTKAGG